MILEIFSNSKGSLIPSPKLILLTGLCPLPFCARSRLPALPLCSALPPHPSPASVTLFLAPFPTSLAAKSDSVQASCIPFQILSYRGK